MMELIHHDNIECVRCDGIELNMRQRLNGCEDMPILLGSVSIDEQFPERPITKDRPVHGQALREYLATVSHE